MRWLDLISKYPTKDEYDQSWYLLFKCYPNECLECELLTDYLYVKSPNMIYVDSGFTKEFIDNPVLKYESNLLWYECGVTWGVDDNREFYYLLDKKTGYPCDWDKVKARETIKAYWKVEKCIKRDEVLSQLLESV